MNELAKPQGEEGSMKLLSSASTIEEESKKLMLEAQNNMIPTDDPEISPDEPNETVSLFQLLLLLSRDTRGNNET